MAESKGEPKKVGIVVKNLTVGGAEKQAVLMANLLSESETVYFIVFNRYDQGLELLEALSGKVIPVILEGNCFTKLKKTRSLIKEKKIDFLFAFLTGANFFTALASFKTPASFYAGLSSSRLEIHKHLSDLTVNRFLSRGTISNSRAAKEWFSKLGFCRDKIKVIRNCFYSSGLPPKEKAGKPVRIITVARFVKEKDYPTALKAIELLSRNNMDFKYTVVGFGGQESKIRMLVKKYKLENIVEIVIRPKDVGRYLKESDIYLCTSLYEGTSNSILEAMDSRLAVVATDVGDNPDLIDEGKGGFLVPAKDYISTAGRLERLIENPDAIKRFGNYNNWKVNRRFTPSVFKERYMDLLYS